MTDSTLVEGSVLKDPFAEAWRPKNKLLGTSLGGLRTIRRWIRFLLLGERLSVPELVDFIGGNHLFLAIQVPSELAALGGILGKLRPERALEIGTAFGGTLLFLAQLASPTATIASVDLPGGELGGYSNRRQWFYRRFARRRQRLHLLRGDSHSAAMLEEVKTVFEGRPLDYLFIDGDHRYEGVKSDFERYGPLVRRGGLIAFHDIVTGPPGHVGGVPDFWREVKAHYRHAEYVKDWKQGGKGIGVLYID